MVEPHTWRRNSILYMNHQQLDLKRTFAVLVRVLQRNNQKDVCKGGVCERERQREMGIAHMAYGIFSPPDHGWHRTSFPKRNGCSHLNWTFVWWSLVHRPHGLGLHTPSSEKTSRASLYSCTTERCKAVGLAFLRLAFHSDICWSSAGSLGAVHKGLQGGGGGSRGPRRGSVSLAFCCLEMHLRFYS